ncbi:hypothetical protein DQ04_03181010 [Trypanosoma grayi]|uniref:hypothetical protein n=1 Tax=Trypanosoma grayi TaxID=71804 RepID=UPI0004F4505C|nr:hypothetical protein DQ04_03181010 [Trypanosoma grayi]KEG10888.1 hypothetical protein DQ04_03181010 [Trypanosoma grayi]
MLFEPSGELRCDYGAYCHALGLTEREEVFSAIATNAEIRREKEAKHTSLRPHSSVFLPADTEAPNPPTPQPVSPPAAAAAPPKRSASTGSGRGKKKNTIVDDAAKSVAPATPPTITFISMRQLRFCLNERDMKPLALAIPHCISLVSVELVGCGLSRESYFLLVEALYKSRRVVSVTVDFNSTARPGFYEDPTVPVVSQSPTPVDALEIKTPLNLPTHPQSDDTAEKGESSGAVAPQSDSFTRTAEESLLVRRVAGADTPTFAPSAYRGLNSVPSQLEVQFREEKERKGRVDNKKQTQLQQQQDQIAQIDKEFPIVVPRGWPAVLLTGVKHLSLRGNGLTDSDVSAMASLLTRHPRSELVSLNLWGNCITDEGAVALARMLKKNRTMQVLDLGHNNIGDVGLLELVDCFRMQEVPLEKLQAYRKRHLTRRDATSRERQLATASTLPAYPSYQELYAAWHQIKFPAVTEEKKEPKKNTQTKAKRTEPVLIRPLTPFDRDCFRMENAVRAPGNTVLRCVNLGNNPRVTLSGAREALRVLSLHEPSDDEEMAALQNSATQPPELYCASLTLRSFVILHSGDPELEEIQRQLTELLHERKVKRPQSPVEIETPVDEVKRKSPRNKK